MSEEQNWVEHRYATEKSLRENPPKVWNAVRAALQDACGSYKKHYHPSGGNLLCELENGVRVRIDLPRPLKMYHEPHHLSDPQIITSIVVEFDYEVPEIRWADDKGSHRIKISANEDKAFLAEGGAEVTADQLSERILSRLLFT